MRVRAAEAEAADTGVARTVAAWPRDVLAGEAQGPLGERGDGLLAVQLARQLLARERERDLDHAHHARGRLEVAYVGLGRADHERGAALAALEQPAQRVQLHRVGDLGADAV